MIVIKGRNFKIIQPEEPEVPGSIVVNLTLSSPATASVINKYNKNKIVMVQWDDANKDVIPALAAAQTINLGDGCDGVIRPRFSTAVNGHNPNLNVGNPPAPQEWGTNSTRLLYNQFAAIIAGGIDVEDHSDFHISVPNLSEAIIDVNKNRKLWYDKIAYLMACGVVPTNFQNYVTAWRNLNYFTAITQGAKDGLPIYPNNEAWSSPAWQRTIGNLNEVPPGFVQLNRIFTESWDNMPMNVIDSLNINSTPDNILFLAIGSHTYNATGWLNFLQHLGQSFFMASAREVFEYKWLKENQASFITQVQNGNQLTINYNVNALPHQIRWRDLTFKLPEGITVNNIQVQGADRFTYKDNIFNIYKERLTWEKWELDSIGVVTPAPDTQAPTAPSNLINPSKTESSIAISWTASVDNVGVTGYDIFVNDEFSKRVFGTTASLTELDEDTLYSIKVRATDLANNISAFSNIINITTDEAPEVIIEDYTHTEVVFKSVDHWNQNYAAIISTPPNYDENRAKKFPVLFMFTGDGQIPGSGGFNLSLIKNQVVLYNRINSGALNQTEAIYVQPQMPPNSGGTWAIQFCREFVEVICGIRPVPGNQPTGPINGIGITGYKAYNIDRNKIHIAGLSRGGEAITRLVKDKPYGFFATVWHFSAINNEINTPQLAALVEYFWGTHNVPDSQVGVANLDRWINNLPPDALSVVYKRNSTGGHDTWTSELNSNDVFNWAFSKSRQDFSDIDANTNLPFNDGPESPEEPSEPDLTSEKRIYINTMAVAWKNDIGGLDHIVKRWNRESTVITDTVDVYNLNFSPNTYGDWVIEPEQHLTINKIEIEDIQGSFSTPFRVQGLDEDGEVLFEESFNGNGYGVKVMRTLSNPSKPHKIRFLATRVPGAFLVPPLIRFFGREAVGYQYPIVQKQQPELYDWFGGNVNTHPWDWQADTTTGNFVNGVYQPKADHLVGMFFRMYLDGRHIVHGLDENGKQKISINPTYNVGIWLIPLLQHIKSIGAEINLAMPKLTVPERQVYVDHSTTSATDSLQKINDELRPYGDGLDPETYRGIGERGYMLMAMVGYGNVDIDDIDVSTEIPYFGATPSGKYANLGLVKYISCDNERKKPWFRGLNEFSNNAYSTAEEMAVQMSVFYDGHNNTMGPKIGVKNADPNCIVVMPGLSSDSPDDLYFINEWCKENRGYKEDGSVNLCFDVVEYHSYISDDGSSQSGHTGLGNSTAPELSNFTEKSMRFRYMVDYILKRPDMKIIMGETGFSIFENSRYLVKDVPGFTLEETQANWSLRHAIEMASNGYINKANFYQAFDDPNTDAYNMSGFIKSGTNTFKIQGAYHAQVFRLLRGYKWAEDISNSPRVKRFSKPDYPDIYYIVMPNEIGSTANYSMYIPNDKGGIRLYTLDKGEGNPATVELPKNNNSVIIEVTETPKFFEIIN